jgi:hypothetical protein
VVGQPIRFAGVVEDEAISSVAFQFNGPDTLIFHTPLEDGAFAQQLKFSVLQIGSYEFLVFTGRGNNPLEFAGRFGPIPVVGEQSPTAVETLDALPRAAALGQAFPNPFNGGTVIPFELGAAQAVKLEIYNILGQRVRRLPRGQIEEGRHRVFWNGRDDQGQALGTGVYFYRLEVGPYRAVRRRLLLR